MARHVTTKGREVEHLHRLLNEPEIHAADLELLRRIMAEQFPQAEIVKRATIRYNCHGFALAPRHEGWYNFPDFFLSDDYIGVALNSPQLGDVLIYGRNGAISHSAVVIEISGSTIVRLQSKWGRVNEVKHPVCHVPAIYGEPIVLLRLRPFLDQHPAVTEVTDVSATIKCGAEESADRSEPDAEAGTAERVNERENIPERLLLMFASTPEVERQIRQSTQGRSAVPFDAPSPLVDNSETFWTNDTWDEIQNALAEFSAPLSQFQLMLASTPQVLRDAASGLRPVQDLIRLDKTNPRTRKAIVEFFKKPETQADEDIAGITLFTLARLPSKEAVPVIARYLAAGKFSSFNGSLAVDALKEAVTLATS